MQSTAEFHDQIAGPFFPQAHPVFNDAAALDTAVDMVEPQPTLVQRLVRHVLLPRERLPHIRINSNVVEQDHRGVKRPCTCSLRVIWLALSGAVRMMFTRQS